jgi:uncharacterized protein
VTASDFLTGLAFVAIIEGLVLVLAPGRIGEILQVINRTPPDTLRAIGLGAVACGVALLYIAR